MGYEDFMKIQEKLDNTQKLWHKVEECKDKFKISVQYNSKVIFYEDLYNQLSSQEKENFSSAEELRDNLNMYFKYENTKFHFVKSYKDVVMKKFEKGYLWDKITSDKKYEKLYFARPEDKNDKFVANMNDRDFAVFPPSYVETAEFDCLRDNGILYAEKLKHANVDTEINFTIGTIHGYDMVENSPITQKSLEKRILFLKKIFK